MLVNVCAQPVTVNRIRIGVDPVRSLSMLFKEKDFYNNAFFFNTWECNAEIIGPYRTSIIIEAGHTKAHLQPLNGTLDYYSKGLYGKVGLDFNLTEEDSKYEFDIGWRMAYSSYLDHAFINLVGAYWESRMQKTYPESKRQHIWGELIFNQKVRLFYEHQDLNDFYFGVSLRLKFMNGLHNLDGFHSLLIPGYGPAGSFAPGITFNLCYQFNIKRGRIKQLVHKHDNEFITK